MIQEKTIAKKLSAICFLITTVVVFHACAPGKESTGGNLIIKEQGSFTTGGIVITSPGVFDAYKPTAAGQTFHGDHAYVFYQVPVNARKYPLVMWHGIGQFSKTWETTPDGREGFQNIFLRNLERALVGEYQNINRNSEH